MLHYTRLCSLTKDKHSCLLGLFLSYKENEVLNTASEDFVNSQATNIQGLLNTLCKMVSRFGIRIS